MKFDRSTFSHAVQVENQKIDFNLCLNQSLYYSRRFHDKLLSIELLIEFFWWGELFDLDMWSSRLIRSWPLGPSSWQAFSHVYFFTWYMLSVYMQYCFYNQVFEFCTSKHQWLKLCSLESEVIRPDFQLFDNLN